MSSPGSGKRAEAHKEIAKARLLSDDPEILYQAACVYSITSKTHEARPAEALELLRQAYQEGYRDLSGLANDRDLENIRGLKEFKEIQQGADALFR